MLIRRGSTRNGDQEPRDPLDPADRQQWSADLPAAVGDELDARREHLHQRGQVAGHGRGEKPLRDMAVGHGVRVEPGTALPNVIARSPGQLPDGGLRPVDRLGDLGVGEAEALAQHEHRSLQRGHRLEDHEQRHRDGFGQHDLIGHVAGRSARRDGLRQPCAHVLLTARLPTPKPVDRQARRDPNEECARVADVVAVDARPAQPRVLDHVLRVGNLAEDPVRDPGEDVAMGGEDRSRIARIGGHGSGSAVAGARLAGHQVTRVAHVPRTRPAPRS